MVVVALPATLLLTVGLWYLDIDGVVRFIIVLGAVLVISALAGARQKPDLSYTREGAL